MMLKVKNVLRQFWPLILATLALILIFGREQYLMGSLPIGFDVSTAYLNVLTAHTAPAVTLTSFSLLYGILYEFSRLGLDSLVILKLVGIFLPVATAGSIVWAVKPYLKLTVGQAACFLVLIALQMGFLRLSWDLYRNLLGLFFLCVAAGAIYRGFHPRIQVRWLIVAAIAALLTFLSHQMVGLILVAGTLLSAVYLFIPRRFPLWRWITVGLTAIILLCVGRSFSAFSFSLLISQTVPRTSVISLYIIALGYLNPFAILGFIRLRQPVLWAMSLLLILLALSPLLAPSSAYLWDRWLYILTVPLSVLAAGGIQFLAGKHRLNMLIWIICTGVLIWPGLQFVVANQALPNRSDDLYSMFPQKFLWNAIGFEKESDLKAAITVLRTYDDGYSPIVISANYEGFFPYLAPDLANRVHIPEPANPPWSAPLPKYYLYGIDFGRFAQGDLLPGSPVREPVWSYHVVQL